LLLRVCHGPYDADDDERHLTSPRFADGSYGRTRDGLDYELVCVDGVHALWNR
jgi:hypothetical protein